MPSNTVTGPYKQNIAMYRTKIDQAKSQDDVSAKKFNDQKGELELLSKTPQDLEAMMPISESGVALAQKPVAVAIKGALDDIEAAKK